MASRSRSSWPRREFRCSVSTGLRAKLDDRFRLLTGGARFAPRRHQTLRAALEWSHSLLTSDEQTVFRRLGVFTGTFGLEPAQRVAGAGTIDEWSVLEILGTLVDKSLVVAEAGAEPRYRMLETGRAYALEQLASSGELDVMLRQHAEALLAVFDRSRDEYWTMTTGAAHRPLRRRYRQPARGTGLGSRSRHRRSSHRPDRCLELAVARRRPTCRRAATV